MKVKDKPKNKAYLKKYTFEPKKSSYMWVLQYDNPIDIFSHAEWILILNSGTKLSLRR